MLKRYFVMINHPVGRYLPYVERVFLPTPYIETLFKKQEEDNPFLSKRELESLCVFPMVGPRYSFLEVEIDPNLKEFR